jgi:hypothetical protein
LMSFVPTSNDEASDAAHWLPCTAPRPAAASRRSLQPYVSSLPLTQSSLVKTILQGGPFQRGQISFRHKTEAAPINAGIVQYSRSGLTNRIDVPASLGGLPLKRFLQAYIEPRY